MSWAPTQTRAPAFVRTRVVSRPIPEWPPVITHTFPRRSIPEAISSAVVSAPNPDFKGFCSVFKIVTPLDSLPSRINLLRRAGMFGRDQESKQRLGPRFGGCRVLASNKPSVGDDEACPVRGLFVPPAQALQLVFHEERHNLGEVDCF